MTHHTDWSGLTSQHDDTVILRAVVAQHIVDGLHSGNPTAEVLARSLMTELDAAGIDLTAAINAINATRGKAVNG